MRKVIKSVWYMLVFHYHYLCLTCALFLTFITPIEFERLGYYSCQIPPYNYAPDQGMIIVPRVPEEEYYPALPPYYYAPHQVMIIVPQVPKVECYPAVAVVKPVRFSRLRSVMKMLLSRSTQKK